MQASIKFLKYTLKKSVNTNADPHIAVLQVRSTLLGQGIPSAGTL